ncbi:MAG: quinol:cytochrome C oxidoreductase, partial [Melioribacteraceae bacterium]|nr:quinol:cytochrome C oxidoreductase [Melioribacteraceae bacterium]
MSSTENEIEYNKKGLPPIFGKFGFGLFGIGLVLSTLAYISEPTRSAFNNIILLEFLSSVGLGSLFLIALEYIVGAVWSAPFRRVFEIISSVLLVLPLVAIPVYLHAHDVFHWTHLDVVAADEVLKGKSPYLNMTFFTIRIVAYFAIWILFHLLLTKNSKAQDITKDPKLTKTNTTLSAIFLPLFVLTITFSSIDWMMSLEPHWFSTIFSVYYFSGTFLTAVAVGTFLVIWLNEKGLLVKGIGKDHYYSLGALLFGFINFWAYIAFSQFLLIWYANLPEETYWFLARWEGSWMYFSIFLMLIHFVIPYFALLSQPSKINPKTLKIMSLVIIFSHIVDLYWVVMPTFSPEGFVFGWIEIGFILLGLGIIMVVFSLKAKNQNLVAI